MTKERPILFSAPMVRALLDGSKTQTRRVVKAKHLSWLEDSVLNFLDGKWNQRPLPYGKPGDRLWVRETWAYCVHAMAAKREEDGPFVYAADGVPIGRLCERWRPSIHMFRWASRITLEVTAVRVERLQDISAADAFAEGVKEDKADGFFESIEGRFVGVGPQDTYAQLWESINGPNTWAANPWVWVIEFKKLKP